MNQKSDDLYRRQKEDRYDRENEAARKASDRARDKLHQQSMQNNKGCLSLLLIVVVFVGKGAYEIIQNFI